MVAEEVLAVDRVDERSETQWVGGEVLFTLTKGY